MVFLWTVNTTYRFTDFTMLCFEISIMLVAEKDIESDLLVDPAERKEACQDIDRRMPFSPHWRSRKHSGDAGRYFHVEVLD